ncbi:MAG TPA: diguanylate cyclase [Gemmatimonadales bacterium]
MTEQLDGALLALQREYLASLPARLEELKADIQALGQGSASAGASLKGRLHRLAGSGGSFGFSELSAIAREGERWLAVNPSSSDTAPLLSVIERLAMVAFAAEAQLATAQTGDRPAVVPRALVIMRPSPQRERIAQELRGAGYDVRFGARNDHPDALPGELLPHLVIIGGEAGDGDLSAIASAWTNSPDRRPGAVVLVETLRPVDRLRAIAAGVDAVFPAEQVEQKLPRYARTFARVGPPPSSVVLVEHDEARASQIVAALDAANIRGVRVPRNQAVTEILDRELPDLLLLSSRPVDSNPYALIRMIRQDPRYQLLPVVLLGEDNTADRIAALRAGADDFIAVAADSALLVQTVIARAARGRRMRELVHRDGLTGLLNHATLLAELESAVEFSQRYGEPLAFVLFELDGFKAMSQRLGPRAADEVLLHIAGVFRSNVRASDVIGRCGAEAFGMLLRGANASGATVLARNLHRILGEQPARTSVGELVPVRVNVGTAIFPRDGSTAAELAQAADRGVREAGRRDSGAGQ